jgi:hypothetical protein
VTVLPVYLSALTYKSELILDYRHEYSGHNLMGFQLTLIYSLFNHTIKTIRPLKFDKVQIFENDIKNKNGIHKGTKNTLNLGNACYHLFHHLFCLLSAI